MDNHGQLRIQEYADFLRFFASVSLLVISIQGKMKIAHDNARSNLTEPLLNGETGKKFEGKGESLYSKATLLDLVTFSWLNPLFVIGKKKPLEQDEIPDVDVKDSAAFLSHCFDENLINDFVVFLSDKKHSSLKTGYLLALGFLGAKVVETISQRQWIFGARQLGLQLRNALITQIYQKGLVLSCQARQSHTSGEIINYMSVDVQRIADFAWHVNTIWMLPVQISLAIYVLHTSLGLGSFAGLAATLVVMSCNIPFHMQASSDQSVLDLEMAQRLFSAAFSMIQLLGTIAVMSQVAWEVFLIFIPVTAINCKGVSTII